MSEERNNLIEERMNRLENRMENTQFERHVLYLALLMIVFVVILQIF